MLLLICFMCLIKFFSAQPFVAKHMAFIDLVLASNGGYKLNCFFLCIGVFGLYNRIKQFSIFLLGLVFLLFMWES